MAFPQNRLRRLRRTETLRALVRETDLAPRHLVAPLFVKEGIAEPAPISSMPGHHQHTLESLAKEARELHGKGVRAFVLFGIPSDKDAEGSQAWDEDGIAQQGLRALREELGDEAVLVADLCLCEYTDHGHCGVLTADEDVDNDRTLELYGRIAVSQAAAGADLVAPSGMMDGQVAAIRETLDGDGFEGIGILAYAAKFASSFYGPFREAAEGAPRFGDRRGYQMDPANSDEALREIRQDIEEGADMVMVKPALAYLDVIRRAKEETGFPVAAYNVSGEYAMVKAAGERGWIDERQATLEVLTAIRRAGADLILTYHARDAADWLTVSSPVTRSEDLFDRARRLIPGGVSSPVRAFGAVGGTPLFVTEGRGAEIVDADGRRYLDYVQSWGALLFGHAREEIVEAATEAARRGTSFGAPTEAEVRLAEAIVDLVPSVDMVRLVSSGTEAAMSAVRLARAHTGRPKVVKFAGCYHGHADPLLARAGSGVATFELPGTPGITKGASGDTIVLPYNDLEPVDAVFAENGGDIACVIVEPVAANMGVVPPEAGFLEGLRRATEGHGAVLIFDEVITGFRLAPGGAQELYGVTPDLSVLGKVMGGGFPCAAFGGRREIMDRLAPAGDVYQAGTLSGNPVAVAAGLAALELIRTEEPHATLAKTAARLSDGLSAALNEAGVAHSINRAESLLSVFFGDGPVRSYEDAAAADHEAYARFFHGMLDRGVYLPPSGYEAWFLSTAHGDAEVDRTLEAAATWPS